jgi:hypothetical protein
LLGVSRMSCSGGRHTSKRNLLTSSLTGQILDLQPLVLGGEAPAALKTSKIALPATYSFAAAMGCDALWFCAMRAVGYAMRYLACLSIVAVSLCGCVDAPLLDLPHKGVTVSQILHRIDCEIFDAIKDNPRLVAESWTSVGALTVQVDDEGSLAASTTFINPLAAAGTSFTFSAGGGITADRERIYAENFSIDIASLKKTMKPGTCDVR